jgi:hypothetical protein
MRAATSAPASGPITPATVMADWISEMERRTSPPRLPAMMKAKVEAAPITPRSSRERSSSGRVWARAMTKKPAPCRSSIQT